MGEPLIIIGKGMAATRLVEELTRRQLGRYSIIVIGAEPHRAYNRVLLSSVLAGVVSVEDIELRPADWWRALGVTTIYGQAAVAVDRDLKTVTMADGTELSYSKLVFSTGSLPIRLPKPGMTLPGVITFRDLSDIDIMLAAARAKTRSVVIGGGLLGLEAAYGLAKAGVSVTLIHLMDRLMERQLDEPAAIMLREAITAKGVEVILQADTARILGSDKAEGLELADGRVLPADLIVCAVGIRPNIELARNAGIAVNRGIIVDDQLCSSDAGIFALGECAEHRGVVYGLVEPAYEQAKVLASALCGAVDTAYPGTVLATNLKVSGVSVFSAGDFSDRPGTEIVTFSDAGLNTYKKLVLENGKLAGAVLFGDTADGLWYLDLIRSGVNVDALRDMLIFGKDAVELAA